MLKFDKEKQIIYEHSLKAKVNNMITSLNC